MGALPRFTGPFLPGSPGPGAMYRLNHTPIGPVQDHYISKEVPHRNDVTLIYFAY
jgi:hypothetical protein